MAMLSNKEMIADAPLLNIKPIINTVVTLLTFIENHKMIIEKKKLPSNDANTNTELSRKEILLKEIPKDEAPIIKKATTKDEPLVMPNI